MFDGKAYLLNSHVAFYKQLKFILMPLRNITILLIDDDYDDWEIFDLVIKEIDPSIKVLHVGYCENAIENLSKKSINPDYIFLDLNMPKMPGHECLIYLKQIEHLQHIPISIYSTSRHLLERENLLEKGANYYVNKSNTFDKLLSQIKRIIEN